MELDAMILVFLIFSFKSAFSLSSFTLIKRFFSSSSFSTIRVVSSPYLRLLVFLLTILIPAWNGILLSHKKEWTICSNMDGPRDYHTKWSKSERERQIPWYHLCVKSKIWHKWTHTWNRNRFTVIENKLVVVLGEGEWWREGLGVWD